MKDEMKTALETAMDAFDQKKSDAAKRQEVARIKVGKMPKRLVVASAPQ